MTKKIFRSILGAAVTVLLASLLVITLFLYNYFGAVQKDQLKDELSLAVVATEQMGIDYLSGVESDNYRLTWIDAKGNIIFDTKVKAAEMENHLEREEVQKALKQGRGSSRRRSSTLMESTSYEAVRLADGTVLRISTSQATIVALIVGMFLPLTLIVIVAVFLSMFLARRMAGHITEPFDKIDLEKPLDNNTYEELSPLLTRIYHQQEKITEQMKSLSKQKEEFEQVTGNMREGLVLLDCRQRILSINPAAVELFQTTQDCVGEDFLTVDRKHEISLAIEKAMKDGHSEIKAERNGREYQFDISRIESGEGSKGAVLLIFDITEKEETERIRREFSANVSHELKTPLQSIIGSSELIENDLVKKEDMPRFIGRIHEEASRLVVLIEDIIRLSQLDEGCEMPMEEVSLSAITNDVFHSLQETAAEQDITLHVEGVVGNFYGVRRLLYEILYNLCDNAVKYNVKGGNVKVKLSETEKELTCVVEDTGIGIPKEHQSRVFERFYRVDKSHSKKSGGTGLGMSIVKHAVKQHGGTIALESKENVGTKITLTFPKIEKN